MSSKELIVFNTNSQIKLIFLEDILDILTKDCTESDQHARDNSCAKIPSSFYSFAFIRSLCKKQQNCFLQKKETNIIINRVHCSTTLKL